MKIDNIPQGFWVFCGGGAGATTRAVLLDFFPVTSDVSEPGFLAQVPWGVLVINCLGAGLLGFLLSYLALAGERGTATQKPGRLAAYQTLRLGLGTGFLGGFTTYSTFAVGLVVLARQGLWVAAFAYATVSLMVGFLLCWVGFRCAERVISGHGGEKV